MKRIPAGYMCTLFRANPENAHANPRPQLKLQIWRRGCTVGNAGTNCSRILTAAANAPSTRLALRLGRTKTTKYTALQQQRRTYLPERSTKTPVHWNITNSG
jgi:hypothetical protein